MKKKIIILIITAALLAVVIRACYLKDHKTVLIFSREECRFVISPDSISISTYFFVEDKTTLVAVVDFESLKDSLFLPKLDITVHSSDNPDQAIRLKKVSTPVHPVTNTNGNLEKLEVKNFDDLPLYYKTIRNSGLPYNTILFHFKTDEISKTDFYYFKISGKLIYKGQEFILEKEVKTERKVEYHRYRMRT
jgi:hypothetical protein